MPVQEARSVIRCEDVPGHGSYRHLSRLAGVAHDIRYAGTHNFSGRSLYGNLDCAWLHAAAADGLERAAAWLAVQRPGYRLLVLDALRPQRVQEAIWRDIKDTPMADYFADPVRGSIHSFGMAVDVTLLDAQGLECDMGTGYDEMTPRSHPSLETQHLARGLLTTEQLFERGWLYAAMAEGGFSGIASEWWHFDHGDREQVRRLMPRII